MVRTMLNDAITHGNYNNLLRATRWSLAAPKNITWRKGLLKVLAQTFTASDVDPELRLKIGRAMVLAAGEGARAFFIRDAAPSFNGDSRRWTAWIGLGRLTARDALISSALQDQDTLICESAVLALADLGTSGAVRVLQNAMLSLNEELLPTIAASLAKSAEGQEVLKEAVTNESLLIRRTAAQGLSAVAEPWAVEILEKLAREDSEWLVRSSAEIGLNAREARANAKIVVGAPPQIDQTEWLIAWAAQQGQGLGVGKAAMEMLERATTGDDSQSKMLAAMTLAYIGQQSHRDLLEPLLADADLMVRQIVEQAIHRIDQRYYVFQ